MDAAGLMLVLSRTLDPRQREEAEKQLEEVGIGLLPGGTYRMGARVRGYECTKLLHCNRY